MRSRNIGADGEWHRSECLRAVAFESLRLRSIAMAFMVSGIYCSIYGNIGHELAHQAERGSFSMHMFVQYQKQRYESFACLLLLLP